MYPMKQIDAANSNRHAPEFIPALRFHALTGLFDAAVRVGVREGTFKSRLLEPMNLGPGTTALDVGCGTGTLLALALKRFPECSFTGLDGDPAILARAEGKLNGGATLVAGLAHELPFPDGSFDAVMSSLVFHHLTTDRKHAALREIRRVLKPGGMFHLADYGKARNPLERLAFLQVQLLDGFASTGDHAAGRLPGFLGECGFADIHLTDEILTATGVVAILRARR